MLGNNNEWPYVEAYTGIGDEIIINKVGNKKNIIIIECENRQYYCKQKPNQ